MKKVEKYYKNINIRQLKGNSKRKQNNEIRFICGPI